MARFMASFQPPSILSVSGFGPRFLGVTFFLLMLYTLRGFDFNAVGGSRTRNLGQEK